MRIQIQGLQEINGPLVVLSHVPNVGFDELVQLQLESGEIRTGRVVEAGRDRCVVQVFEGTNGVSLQNTTATMLGIRHKLIRPYTPRHNGKPCKCTQFKYYGGAASGNRGYDRSL